MLVSVVVCTHSLDNYQNLAEAVGSLLQQAHQEIEIVVVVDGNKELHQGCWQIMAAKRRLRLSR